MLTAHEMTSAPGASTPMSNRSPLQPIGQQINQSRFNNEENAVSSSHAIVKKEPTNPGKSVKNGKFLESNHMLICCVITVR